MTNEEAIKILERGSKIPGDGYTWEEIVEALRIAVQALKQEEPSLGEPLTMEQLREMDGEPVFYKSLVENKSGWAIIRIVKLQKEWIIELHGMLQKVAAGKDTYEETWLAYAYPPSCLDMDEWEPCGNCKPSCGNCIDCYADEEDFPLTCQCCANHNNYRPKDKYCSACGRPLKPEARAELEKRLRG